MKEISLDLTFQANPIIPSSTLSSVYSTLCCLSIYSCIEVFSIYHWYITQAFPCLNAEMGLYITRITFLKIDLWLISQAFWLVGWPTTELVQL